MRATFLALALLLFCAPTSLASDDPTLDAVEKALQAINSERGSISVVGRALSEQEKRRLRKLEDAEEWVGKARERLATVDGDKDGETDKPEKD